jgi:hypothetical protein
MNTKETDPVWVDAGDDSLEALGQRSQELEEREAESNGRSRAVGLRSPTVTLDEPDAQLLAHQVADSVNAGPLGHERQRDMMECSLALYAALEPGDATESVLARLTVATSNASMDSFSRAAQSGCHAVARDLNLKYGIKAALAVVELTKALDQHRGRYRQTVSVGQVNVQAGGRAIVGNVAPREKRKEPQEHGPPDLAPTSPESHSEE